MANVKDGSIEARLFDAEHGNVFHKGDARDMVEFAQWEAEKLSKHARLIIGVMGVGGADVTNREVEAMLCLFSDKLRMVSEALNIALEKHVEKAGKGL